MATRTAKAEWKGDLPTGEGTFSAESGQVGGDYSFKSRFQEGGASNPEELIAAAHASCFSMALSLILSEGGNTPDSINTEAKVDIEPEGEGFAIKKIALSTVGRVPGVDDAGFQKAAEAAKDACPVSKALAAVPEISLDARLEGS
jgi:osmotically inducible protein OsmC